MKPAVLSYDLAESILRQLYGYSIRFARRILRECREGFPFSQPGATLYYRSDSRYEIIAE